MKPVRPAAVLQAYILHSQVIELQVRKTHAETIMTVDVYRPVFWERLVQLSQTIVRQPLLLLGIGSIQADDIERARNMTDGLVAVRVIAHFQHDQVLVLDVFGKPVGINQKIGPCVSRGP